MKLINAISHSRDRSGNSKRRFFGGVIGGSTAAAADGLRRMGPCWHEMGIGEIKLVSMFGFIRAVVRSVPVGRGRATSVDVVMMSWSLGVEAVMGLGSK